jgi:hypothetical protein
MAAAQWNSVWRWQERFMAEGVPGLLHDKTRPARTPPLGTEVEERVVAATGEGSNGLACRRSQSIGSGMSSSSTPILLAVVHAERSGNVRRHRGQPSDAFRIVVVNLLGRGVLADPSIHVGRSRQYERAARLRREDLG